MRIFSPEYTRQTTSPLGIMIGVLALKGRWGQKYRRGVGYLFIGFFVAAMAVAIWKSTRKGKPDSNEDSGRNNNGIAKGRPHQPRITGKVPATPEAVFVWSEFVFFVLLSLLMAAGDFLMCDPINELWEEWVGLASWIVGLVATILTGACCVLEHVFDEWDRLGSNLESLRNLVLSIVRAIRNLKTLKFRGSLRNLTILLLKPQNGNQPPVEIAIPLSPYIEAVLWPLMIIGGTTLMLGTDNSDWRFFFGTSQSILGVCLTLLITYNHAKHKRSSARKFRTHEFVAWSVSPVLFTFGVTISDPLDQENWRSQLGLYIAIFGISISFHACGIWKFGESSLKANVRFAKTSSRISMTGPRRNEYTVESDLGQATAREEAQEESLSAAAIEFNARDYRAKVVGPEAILNGVTILSGCNEFGFWMVIAILLIVIGLINIVFSYGKPGKQLGKRPTSKDSGSADRTAGPS